MYMALYIEINVTCIFILGIILHKLYGSVSMQTEKKLFMGVLINAGILLILDALWGLISATVLKVSVSIGWLVNVLYMCQTGILGHSWFMYTMVCINPEIQRQRKKALLYSIPMFALFIFSILSIWNKWMFYIDSDMTYHRGNLFAIQAMLGYGYVLCAAIIALIAAIKEKNYIRKKEFYTLASFIILPMFCGILQVVFMGVPLLSVGVTLSLLLIFMAFQESQISRDPLTLLNNRNQLQKYLSIKMNTQNNMRKLFLIMIDVDYFKQINDKYGHIEGDTALKSIAEILKEICGNRNCFIARYGGDEFVIVFEANTAPEAMRMKRQIYDMIEKDNEKRIKKYNMSVSIGVAQYREEMKTIQQFIAAADKELYEVKKKRHKKVSLS